MVQFSSILSLWPVPSTSPLLIIRIEYRTVHPRILYYFEYRNHPTSRVAVLHPVTSRIQHKKPQTRPSGPPHLIIQLSSTSRHSPSLSLQITMKVITVLASVITLYLPALVLATCGSGYYQCGRKYHSVVVLTF